MPAKSVRCRWRSTNRACIHIPLPTALPETKTPCPYQRQRIEAHVFPLPKRHVPSPYLDGFP